MSLNPGSVGLWTWSFDGHPAGLLRDGAAEIEELGYGALWFGESLAREAFTQAGLLLGATSRIVVATGIARVFLRDPAAAAHAQLTLAEAYPDRFLLGLGGKIASNQGVIPGVIDRPGTPKPMAAMAGYLDAMDEATSKVERYFGLPERPRRVLAALGPDMLRLSAERGWGAHPYFVPVAHTESARKIVGPNAFLGVEQAVVLEPDRAKAKEIARMHTSLYVTVQHHRNNLTRLGYDESDFANGGSDRLVDAIVAGHTGRDPLESIKKRVSDQLAAGASHVCVQVLTEDLGRIPLPEWRELAPALL
jgi:probable F420-dependent oxidoreductase